MSTIFVGRKGSTLDTSDAALAKQEFNRASSSIKRDIFISPSPWGRDEREGYKWPVLIFLGQKKLPLAGGNHSESYEYFPAALLSAATNPCSLRVFVKKDSPDRR